uniref:Uncharacterized protein n=1 Tax=Timema shepardi TaxID=629360 RepID=A0A7R9G1E5_TIMSH|nr:unnamed protein product [Timema shepardi]
MKKNGNLTSVYEFIHIFFFHKLATLGTVSLLCAEAKKKRNIIDNVNVSGYVRIDKHKGTLQILCKSNDDIFM